jgi:hypothetical protein
VLQRELFDPYRLKTVPMIICWVALQRRLWREHSRERSTVNREP